VTKNTGPLSRSLAGIANRSPINRHFREHSFIKVRRPIRWRGSRAVRAWAIDGQSLQWTALYPAFVGGEAYVALHQGREAAVEFQKILDHCGIVLNKPIGALAHLQLGRAYTMQGDTSKAKAAYQDFFTL
jgi:hypothetical protein